MFEFFSAVAGALAVAAPVIQNLGEIAQGGRGIVDFAAEILGRFRRQVAPDKQQFAMRQALTQAAALPEEDFDRKMVEIVDVVLVNRPEEDKKAATEYLKLFPARIRATLIRPDDPTGTTVPAAFAVNRPEDIVGFIPPRPPMFKAGDTPPESRRWILVERLAIGGFSEVWKARHEKLQNTFSAFKFCLDPVSQKSIFENELGTVELVMKELVDHPNVVKLMDVCLESETPWLQYEYIPGGTLGRLVSTWPDDVAARAALALQHTSVLATTLAHCHDLKPKCLIHRDMKPANVLIDRSGTPKIADFGISVAQARHALDEARLTVVAGLTVSTPSAVRFASTPMYASDQQQNGEDPHPSDDVHALGVMLYQMILGDVNRPLNRDYIAVLERHKICRELITLISRSIASDRQARFQHAGELAEAIKSLPARLIAEPAVVSVVGQEKLLYDQFDVYVADARTKNQQARAFSEKRQWKQAKQAMDEIFHPSLRDRELYKYISLYAEGKRLKNSLGMEFAWVPPGTSWLGGSAGKPGERQFSVEEGFWAGVYPVTQSEWEAVLGSNPSEFEGNPRFPVESVSWDEITRSFLPELNKRCREDGYEYRLPTEDEWEYLCRGGPISRKLSAFDFYFAKSRTVLTSQPTNDLTDDLANFGNSDGRPSEVGSFLPNPLGIYDLHGNVWEWTSTASGLSRVDRGGAWDSPPYDCTAARRDADSPDDANCVLGFRLLAVPLEA